MDTLTDVQAVAAEAFATLDTGRQIGPFSSRLSFFDLDDAYRVTAVVRKMRETAGAARRTKDWVHESHDLGRIQRVRTGLGICLRSHGAQPIRDRRYVPARGSREPRIEPEIVFKLAVAPAPGMGEGALLESIDWVDMVSKSYSRSLLDGSFPRPTRSRRSVCTAPCSLGLVIQSQGTPKIGAGRFRPSKSI